MTTDQQENLPQEVPRPNFVTRFLPWIIAGGVLLIYLFTLNHWVTLRSLPIVAKIAGWDWRPGNFTGGATPIAPLYFLLTYPIRWLSEGGQMLALNLFSTICATLTLALLARSVALLPHDRTREQRQRETGPAAMLNVPHAWLAPFIAVLVCGLQLAFWENAIAASGELLELLLFAYVIRCLLEFRVSQKESWLAKFALVYGIGITNNWAMIGFFPLFLGALIWIKGLSFFSYRFMARMVCFGLVGLSLYLLFPLLATFSANPDQTFFQTLRDHLRYQKAYVFDLPFKQITSLRSRLLVISLTSLLPLLMVGIRWPSFRGDLSHAGALITTFMFRLVHLFFLGILLWVFFDPGFSARKLGYELMPYLSFYYLSALAVGYFIGYVLLVFGREPAQSWARPSSLMKLVNMVILIAVCIAVLAAPVLLARKNFPAIQATNSDALNQFTKLTASMLPSSEAIVLSDDPGRLHLLRAAYAQMGNPTQNILVETGSLESPVYQRHLHKVYPHDWPKLGTNNSSFSQAKLIEQLGMLDQTHSIYYLHPSFGYYFEKFYPTPHKLVYELKPYPENQIMPPRLTSETIAENQTFWSSFTKEILPKLPALGKNSPEVKLLNSYYSRALNYWGTELQKGKLLEQANQVFATALTLNPDNVAAQINQQSNLNLRRGEIRAIQPDDELQKKLGKYGSVQSALTWNGPFDERDFCLRIGEVFARGKNLRQSAQLFMRALELAPKNIEARIALAKTHLEMQQADKALALVQQLRTEEKITPLNPQNQFELLRTETLCYLAKNDFPTAERIVVTAQRQNPKDEKHVALLAQLYLDTGLLTNALEAVQKQLQIAPENPRALFVKAVLNMQLGQFPPAIETLDHVLKLQPKNFDARLNRAIANFQSGKLDAAKRDYELLLESLPKGNSYPIHFRLAEVAEKQNEKPDAIKNYKLYLKYAPRAAPDRAEAQKRIEKLQSSKS